MLYFALLRFVRKERDKYKENLMNRGQVLKIAFASVVLSTCREGTLKLTSVAFFPSRWVNFFLVHVANKGVPELFSPIHNVVG